jgi:hypothetical protein
MTLRVALLIAIAIVPYTALGQPAGDGAAPTSTSAPATSAEFQAFATRLEQKIGRTFDDHEARLKALENKAAAMSDVVEGSRQALDQIAKSDKNGKSYLRIDASHEPTRLELRDAIEKSTPERGTVMLNNKTSYTQSVSVNGVTYEVVANSKRAIDVPYRGFDVTTSSNRTLHWDFQFPKATRVVDIDYVTSPAPTIASTSNYAMQQMH